MKKILVFVLALVATLFIMGTTIYVDNHGLGYAIYPQVISDTPSAPFTCALQHVAKQIYVDDTNDTAEAYLCFCGQDADDTTWIWLKSQDPSVDCF